MMKIYKIIILSEEIEIIKEGIIKGHVNPLSKKELKNLFEVEKLIYKIISEKNKGEEIQFNYYYLKI